MSLEIRLKLGHPWERRGRPLGEWLKLLTSADGKEEAYDALLSMLHGLHDFNLDVEIQEQLEDSEEKFGREIRQIFATEGFPSTLVLKQVISELRATHEQSRNLGSRYMSLTKEGMKQFVLCGFRTHLLSSIVANAGPAAAGVFDELLALLSFRDEQTSIGTLAETAARAFASMGPAASPAFRDIFKEAAKPRKHWPDPWDETLLALAEQDAALIEELAGFLERGTSAERNVAATVLGWLGPRALPALKAALRVADAGNAAGVASVLGALAGVSPEARERLVVLTRHSDPDTRVCALAFTANLPDTGEAVRLLERGLLDEDANVRWKALSTLCELPIPNEAKAEYCVKMLDDHAGFDEFVPSAEAVRRLKWLNKKEGP